MNEPFPNVFVFDDLVDTDIVQQVWLNVLRKPIWGFGWKSRTDIEDTIYRYWHTLFIGESTPKKLERHELRAFEKTQPTIFKLWKHASQVIIDNLGVPIELSRCYGNAYTYGTGGERHHDDGLWTVLYYGTTPWNNSWRGETMMFNEDNSVHGVVEYIPGRVICFPAKMKHQAIDVSKTCNSVRTIVAFKCV